MGRARAHLPFAVRRGAGAARGAASGGSGASGGGRSVGASSAGALGGGARLPPVGRSAALEAGLAELPRRGPQSPRSPDAQTLVAVTAFGLRRPAAAVAPLEKVIRLAPDRKDAWRLLKAAYAATGRAKSLAALSRRYKARFRDLAVDGGLLSDNYSSPSATTRTPHPNSS